MRLEVFYCCTGTWHTLVAVRVPGYIFVHGLNSTFSFPVRYSGNIGILPLIEHTAALRFHQPATFILPES